MDTTPTAVPSVTEKAGDGSGRVSIHVNQKKTASYYTTLVKKHFETPCTIELVGLGRAIHTCATIAEMLKSSNVATVASINTGIVPSTDEGHSAQKVKISIVLDKHPDFVPSPEPAAAAEPSE